MRNYTSKSDKVAMYSKKYNKSTEEVYRILTEDDSVLTIDELKIKYDDENLADGQLPEGITEQEFEDAIKMQVCKLYDYRYSWWISREDLFGDTYLFLRKRKHLLNSPKHVAGAARNYIKNALDQFMWRNAHMEGSLDNPVKESSSSVEGKASYADVLPSSTAEEDVIEMIHTINSISDSNVRDLLIATGYLLCDIYEFRKEYINLLRRADDQTKQNLKRIEDMLKENDALDMRRFEGEKIGRQKHKIQINTIIDALNLNGNDKICSGNESALASIKYYLSNIWGINYFNMNYKIPSRTKKQQPEKTSYSPVTVYKPDGSVEIQNADGTRTLVSKAVNNPTVSLI